MAVYSLGLLLIVNLLNGCAFVGCALLADFFE